MKENFTYLSADKLTTIHAIRWIPDGQIRAIIQVSHGMTEYADCYDDFARNMNEQGILVTANDHLGHGHSVRGEEYYGYLERIKHIMLDIHHLRQTTEEMYPGIPYFILGHSMGSYFARQYIQLYGKGLSGAVFMGAGSLGNPDQIMGPITCHLLRLRHGRFHYSEFIDTVGFKTFLDRIPNPRTEKDWLCGNPDYVDKYLADPLSMKVKLKVIFYREMGLGVLYLQKPKNIAKIPKDLPIYLIYGEEDPVGNYGADVIGIEAAYKAAGIRDVIRKPYPGLRHNLFFELSKDQVFSDFVEWVEQRI